jgi:hypothetical protein
MCMNWTYCKTETAGLLYLEPLHLRHEIICYHHTCHHETFRTGGTEKRGFALGTVSGDLLMLVITFLVTCAVDMLEGLVASALCLFISCARFGILWTLYCLEKVVIFCDYQFQSCHKSGPSLLHQLYLTRQWTWRILLEKISILEVLC